MLSSLRRLFAEGEFACTGVSSRSIVLFDSLNTFGSVVLPLSRCSNWACMSTFLPVQTLPLGACQADAMHPQRRSFVLIVQP